MQAQSSLSYQGKTRRLVGVQARACELSTQEAEEDQGSIGRVFLKPFPISASNNSTSKSKQLLCGKDWWALSLCL